MSILTERNSIAAKLGKSFAGNRNLYEVFGYSIDLSVDDFYAMYLRGGITKRIIKAYPQATWRDVPNVNDESETFVEAFDKLYEDYKLGHYFERADRLSGIGQYGILLLGFQDGKKLYEPLEKGDHKLLYLKPYIETNADITEWENDEQSPRYGMPKMYTIQSGKSIIGKQTAQKSQKVHHSRVIHIAEMLDEDETYGIPSMMAIFNYLKDLEKVVGGGSEMFWLAAYKGLAFLADKEAQFDDDELETLKDQAEEYQHQLRRIITGRGLDIKELGSDVVESRSNVDVLIDLIAGTTGIPKRILLGNEAGELASSQDETNWNSRIDERRNTFASPCIVRPFIDKMIMTGNLPAPKNDTYTVEWDESDALSEKEVAEIDKTRSETVDRLSRTGTASTETMISIMHPEWGEEEITAEIQKIKTVLPLEMP